MFKKFGTLIGAALLSAIAFAAPEASPKSLTIETAKIVDPVAVKKDVASPPAAASPHQVLTSKWLQGVEKVDKVKMVGGAVMHGRSHHPSASQVGKSDKDGSWAGYDTMKTAGTMGLDPGGASKLGIQFWSGYSFAIDDTGRAGLKPYGSLVIDPVPLGARGLSIGSNTA